MLERAAILIADSACHALVRSVLQSAGFDCASFADLTQMLRSLRRDDYRLVIVDVDAPGEDWRALIPQLRDQTASQSLIIGVGTRPDSASTALDAGADDFVHAPLSRHELHSRIQAAVRRANRDRPPGRALALGPCRLDGSALKLVSAKRQVALTAREAALASALFQRPGALVSRRTLSRIWEVEEDIAGRSIEQHIYQLRRKLKLCVGAALVLRSVYGRGYQLELAIPGDAEGSSVVRTAADSLRSEMAGAGVSTLQPAF